MEELKNKTNSTFNEINIKDKKETPEYKEYRRRWDENPKNNVVGKVPVHLDIELNSTCNLKCVMCFQSFAPPKPEIMNFELYKKLIDEGAAKGVCSIKLQYRGEPLLYPKIVEAVKYAKDKGIIEVMFNTNANLLTEELAKKLIDAGLDKIICSVDGFEKEFYESIRVNGNFDTVVNNIKTLHKLKKKLGKSTPFIRIQMIRLKRIKDIKEHTKKYIKFWSKYADDLGFEDEGDYHIDRNKNEVIECADFKCPDIWRRMLVLCNGQYILCCVDHYGRINLGNAKDKTIEETWLGPIYQNIRSHHLNGTSHVPPLCRRCDSRKIIIQKEKKPCKVIQTDK